MKTPVRKKYGLLFLITCLISYQVKYVAGFPTSEDIQNATCPHDTFKCQYADCCLKDSQMCSKLSDNCEDVFAPGEDPHDMCCNALRTNNTTRDGLIEACKSRFRSLTWQENCKEEPKIEPSNTPATTKPPPTVVPTHQQEKEQVTPISEASSDWELGVGLGVGLGVPLILCVVALILCVVCGADKLLLFKNKLLRKGNTENCFADKSTSMTLFQEDEGSASQPGTNPALSLSQSQDSPVTDIPDTAHIYPEGGIKGRDSENTPLLEIDKFFSPKVLRSPL